MTRRRVENARSGGGGCAVRLRNAARRGRAQRIVETKRQHVHDPPHGHALAREGRGTAGTVSRPRVAQLAGIGAHSPITTSRTRGDLTTTFFEIIGPANHKHAAHRGVSVCDRPGSTPVTFSCDATSEFLRLEFQATAFAVPRDRRQASRHS